MDLELFRQCKSLCVVFKKKPKRKPSKSNNDRNINFTTRWQHGKNTGSNDRRSRRKLSGYQLLPFCMLTRSDVWCLLSWLKSLKMEDDEQRRSFMFLMTYLLLKRRRDISNADMLRRREVQRRIRHRHYFFQRQRRLLMVSASLQG